MSRRLLGVSVLGLFLLSACETYREVPQYTVEDFLGTTNFIGGSFSPDNGKVLVSSNATGIYNAYAIPAEGGEPQQLTNSTEESIFVLGYFPNDERFLYTADVGGNELDHIYVREMDGSVVDLTPGEGHRASFAGWAWDRETFYVMTNERDQRYMDLYEYAVDGYARTLFFQNDDGYQGMEVSPDRRRLALSKIVTNADADIYLHDRQTGETELFSTDEGDVLYFPATFSAEGEYFYYTTDRDHEFTWLERYDLETGERSVVERPAWDVMYASLSWHGSYLVMGINEDARTTLKILDVESGEPVVTPTVRDAEITSVRYSGDESLMAFWASSSRMPSDLFVYDMNGGEPRRLTRSLNPNLDAGDLVDAEVIRFTSYDGVEVPGVLYKPHQASRSNKAPALVWVHGGPGGQSRVGYSALIQYLVNHGYVVYAINNRGSSGYGKTFYHLDDLKHGQDDLDDCVASKEMLIETGYVDPERIGIIGGSYGGYMVLAALAFRPDAFAVGVDQFGISNWYRTVQSIPPWWEAQRAYLEREMGDFDDEQFFRAKSPLFHAENIVKPLMVLQGANDPRVLQVESDEIVAAARANGVPVEYVVFDDEGHGFVKKENQERGYKAILDFLDLHLKGTAVREETQ